MLCIWSHLGLIFQSCFLQAFVDQDLIEIKGAFEKSRNLAKMNKNAIDEFYERNFAHRSSPNVLAWSNATCLFTLAKYFEMQGKSPLKSKIGFANPKCRYLSMHIIEGYISMLTYLGNWKMITRWYWIKFIIK